MGMNISIAFIDRTFLLRALMILHYNSNVYVTLTLSDPGYFRQLTIRGGGFKKPPPPPPPDLENCCVNLHHIIHVHFTRCFRHVPIGIFQKFAILTILQRFENEK